MNKAHQNIDWENKPSDKTPINEYNLNKMDRSVDVIDDRVITLDTTKFDKVDAQTLVRQISFNRDNGVFTITYFNGSTATIDTMLEKLAVNFDYDPVTQRLIIILDDGTEKYVDLSALITQYEFVDTDTIAFVLTEDGKVTAKVKDGSIEEKHLRPDYLADIRVESGKAAAGAASAAASATAAKASEDAAAVSAGTASDKAAEAAQSEENASSSADVATQKADAAAASETAAKASEAAAKESEDAAKESEDNAANSMDAAAESASKSAGSAKESKDYSRMSESYAVGTDGEVRPSDATDNSKFYSDLAQHLTEEAAKLLDQAQKIVTVVAAGAIIPAGTVAFSSLPETPTVGFMYNISDAFVTDDRFAEGAGVYYNPGANVYWTKDGQWDVMIGVQVTGVKGNEETYYRHGNVNITPANIGLGNVGNYKAVSTVRLQGLSATEKTNARDNIGAGTSSFSGNYNDLSDKPEIPVSLPADGGNADTVDGLHFYSVNALPSDAASHTDTIYIIPA